MIAEPIDIRRMFGILDSEKTDGDLAAAIAYASKKIEVETGRKWTGNITREFLGISDGARVVYKVALYPILDAAQIEAAGITTDSGDITVETRPAVSVSDGDFTTIAEANYSVNGTAGEIILEEAVEKGKYVYATYYYDTFAIREVEACLAAYYLSSSMPEGGERAAEIFMRYKEALLKLPLYERATVF